MPKSKDTQSKYAYLLPFDFNTGFKKAPQCYIYTYIVCWLVYAVAVVTARLNNLELSNEFGIISSG